MKENQTDVDRHYDAGHHDRSNQSGGNHASILANIQRQLFHLEKKMDSILGMLQEKQYRGSSPGDKPYRKNPALNASRKSGRFDNPRGGKRDEKSGGKDSGEKFYSRFSRPDGRSGHGSGNKPFRRKPQKRK